jgi:integrase/recombinase XerD
MSRTIPETISEEDLIKILNATKQNNHKLAYLLGFYQALRISEVVNLLPENIDKQQHIIKIKQGKGSKDRNIVIIKPLKLKETAVLSALNKLPVGIKINALQKSFKKIAKAVLGKDLHFHTLRHSGATWLLNKKKWDIRQVQQFLGHSKLQTTEIYCHVSPQDLVELEWKD